MAIKAGLVGVNPKGVDENGMPIASGSGGSVDAYTKAEADSKFATKSDTYSKSETETLLNAKAPTSQLTANSKAFYFAYDATSQKYGYKLDGTGDFIPFESAGGIGWVTPDAPISTGITTSGASLTVSGGGYQEFDYKISQSATMKMVAYDVIVNISSNITAGTTMYIVIPKPIQDANTYKHGLTAYGNDTLLNTLPCMGYSTHASMDSSTKCKVSFSFSQALTSGSKLRLHGMFALSTT